MWQTCNRAGLPKEIKMAYVFSKYGRKLKLPKNNLKIRLDSNRKCINDIKIINQWLIDMSIAECKANKDDYNILFFENENVNNLPPASIDMMNVYLFGETHPELKIEEE